MKRHLKNPLVFLTTGLRIGAAFYILIDPYWGFVWTLLLDWWDSGAVVLLAKMNLKEYHEWDKVLDWLGYLAMIISAYSRPETFIFLLVLFALRTAGQIVFYLKKKRKHFVYFPNLFEFAFFWTLISDDLVLLALLFAIKLFQEYWIHVFIEKHPDNILINPLAALGGKN